MTNQRTKIVVLGGSGFLGQEICRIARSMGHLVVSISRRGRPDSDERWLHGVQWISADVMAPSEWTSNLEGAEALIDCIGEPGPDEDGRPRSAAEAARIVSDAAARHDVDKLVYIGACPIVRGQAQADETPAQLFASTGIDHAVLQLDMIAASDRPESRIAGALQRRIGEVDVSEPELGELRGVRREKVAICALRAALEVDITGTLDADRIAYLGDAMFIQ